MILVVGGVVMIKGTVGGGVRELASGLGDVEVSAPYYNCASLVHGFYVKFVDFGKEIETGGVGLRNDVRFVDFGKEIETGGARLGNKTRPHPKTSPARPRLPNLSVLSP
eukprot:g13667.t1